MIPNAGMPGSGPSNNVSGTVLIALIVVCALLMQFSLHKVEEGNVAVYYRVNFSIKILPFWFLKIFIDLLIACVIAQYLIASTINRWSTYRVSTIVEGFEIASAIAILHYSVLKCWRCPIQAGEGGSVHQYNLSDVICGKSHISLLPLI